MAAPKLTGDAVTDAYLERSRLVTANAGRNPAPLADEMNQRCCSLQSDGTAKIGDARERAHTITPPA